MHFTIDDLYTVGAWLLCTVLVIAVIGGIAYAAISAAGKSSSPAAQGTSEAGG